MRIVADRSRCIGAGQCVMVASDLFAQDEDDGLVVIKMTNVTQERVAEAELAVVSCPTRALALDRVDAGQAD